MKRLLIFIAVLTALPPVQAQTLEACQQAAERNYPLVRQYDLIAKTTALTVANIQKGWLPQLSATAQATLQSDVTAWPTQMQTLLSGMGIDVKGLKKDQYRVGVDVQQTVYDGGTLRSRQETARREGDVQTAETEVQLHQLRQRVNELYFGILLLDEHIKLNRDLQEVLTGNEQKLAAMQKHGTAAESDHLAVKAERLHAAQQLTSLEAGRQTMVRILSALCGIAVTAPSRPPMPQSALVDAPYAEPSALTSLRPELKAIEARLRLADAREHTLDAALMPRLGLFAQGYYGYPGLNMFEDMMHHRWTLNGIVGARLTWNIGALYTRKGDKARLGTERSALAVQRDVFLFNNRLQQLQQRDDAERYRRLAAADEEIISLRQSVRRAAESKLAHGIIDVNDLLREINAENSARVQQSVHEIEMLKSAYEWETLKR